MPSAAVVRGRRTRPGPALERTTLAGIRTMTLVRFYRENHH